MSSTFGRGFTSHRMLLFSGAKSTHMQIAPSFLGTTTIPVHHRVGLTTFEITPIGSIWSSSVLTFGRSGGGTCLGANEWGVVSGFRQISYSSPRFPSHWNTEGNCCMTSTVISAVAVVESDSAASTRTASPRVEIAGSPRRFVLRPSITNTHCCNFSLVCNGSPKLSTGP